jgi:hypothetical protein
MSRFHPKYFALETGLLQKFVNGRYPDLKFDALVLPEDGLHLEVDANRGDEGRRERVVRVPGTEVTTFKIFLAKKIGEKIGDFDSKHS